MRQEMIKAGRGKKGRKKKSGARTKGFSKSADRFQISQLATLVHCDPFLPTLCPPFRPIPSCSVLTRFSSTGKLDRIGCVTGPGIIHGCRIYPLIMSDPISCDGSTPDELWAIVASLFGQM